MKHCLHQSRGEEGSQFQSEERGVERSQMIHPRVDQPPSGVTVGRAGTLISYHQGAGSGIRVSSSRGTFCFWWRVGSS